MATAPPQEGGKKTAAAPVRPRPFVAGTRRVDKNSYDVSTTLTTSTQDLRVYNVDPNGFLSHVYVLVEATASGNSANVAFNADAPWTVIDSVGFFDTNSKPIVGPFTGYDLFIANKYGGYSLIDDPRLSTQYSATTGTGGTGGSFSFVLRIPLELVKRDALGALINKSASATYSVQIRLAASTTVYSTAPTAQPTVRVRLIQQGWMDPNLTDMRGNPVSQDPPAAQTTQYWSKQNYTVSAGAMEQKLQGIDSLVRNLVFVMRDGSNSRTQGDADWPDPFRLQYEVAQPVNRPRAFWRHLIGETYGYTGTVETGGGRDYGVYPECYCHDFQHKPGGETRLGYLPVSSATFLNAAGTITGSGSHTLTVLVNKVVPADGNPLSLTGV